MAARSAVRLIALCVATHALSAQAKPTKPADVARVAVTTRDKQLAAAAQHDGLPHALNAAMSADAALLYPTAPIIQGRTAATIFLSGQPELATLQLTWSPMFVFVSDDGTLAVAAGTTAITAGNDYRAGKYINVWRKTKTGYDLAAHVQIGLIKDPANNTTAVSRLTPLPGTARAAAFDAADRAFAKFAGDSGAPAAFYEFAAPTAVTFGGAGAPNIGRGAIRDRMAANTTPTTWAWAPVLSDASLDGSLGITIGEAKIVATPGPQDVSTSLSKYLTVWRRMPDGSIKFLLDGGNSRPGEPQHLP